ncbi:diaminopropionate ammonia-lyase [Propylenella binzhouense]|uniref:diaminopropionate ammonia-lyase n=1 Tax=Propylenella binzhouense TaxID=2555902 RepID=UPI00136F76A2
MPEPISRPEFFLSPLHDEDGAYDDGLKRIVGWDLAREAIARITAWPGYRPTPVLSFKGLARRCGVAAIDCKYEGARFGIGSFKALGGAYALQRVLEGWRGAPDGPVAATASDGNHGLSLAWGARKAGIRCVVFLHSGVSPMRQSLIEAQGAEIIRVDGNYDVSTATARRVAAENGWVLVPDTSHDYDINPVHVMAGYGVMVEELLGEAAQLAMPTHVFIQGGCGGLAAAIIGLLRERFPGDLGPRCIIVEPTKADCLIRSARAGRPLIIEGALDTIMAGLSVGEASGLAWPVIAHGTDAFMTTTDELAIWVMQGLHLGAFGDAPVDVGDSGVAGLAGLISLSGERDLRAAIGLDDQSRVLVIATEGPVDLDGFKALCARDLSGTGLPDFAAFAVAA